MAEFTTASRIGVNNSFSKKITYKRKQNLELSGQIKEYLEINHGITLPSSKKALKERPDHFLHDPETGESYDHYFELANAYYDLNKSNKGVYAIFNQGNQQRQQMLSCWYSRHRLDHVWNFRKSRLIRKVWSSYLKENPLHENYNPMHLVLTVPHKGGVWAGKRFYARELLQKFNHLRKHKLWKQAVYAGEYGVEVSKPKNSENGLHIHLHCLVFQYKNLSRNKVSEIIKAVWEKLTGANKIHYEGLYIFRKDDSGKWITTEEEPSVYYTDTDSKAVQIGNVKRYRKKFYLNGKWFNDLSENEKRENYVIGILEAIKYHFKNDSLKNSDGSYNIPLIGEVAEHSKYLRMYSKFGGFYGVSALNYSRLEEKEEEIQESQLREFETEAEFQEYIQELLKDEEKHDQTEIINSLDDDEVEEIPNELLEAADLELAEKSLVNPFTKKPAKRSEYERYLAFPEYMLHAPKHSNLKNRPFVQDSKHYFKINPALDLKSIMKYIGIGDYFRLLELEDFERLNIYKYKLNLN